MAIATIVGDINKPERERADYTGLIEHINKLTDAIVTEATIVEQAPAEVVVAAAPAAVEPEVEDAEIAAIFTEESAELLEMADKALGEWTKDKAARQAMDELKRHLHTLKGGARMAGISAMGNLSHELETLIISVDDGRVKASSGIADLLQHSLDELHRMRDAVMAGKGVHGGGGFY